MAAAGSTRLDYGSLETTATDRTELPRYSRQNSASGDQQQSPDEDGGSRKTSVSVTICGTYDDTIATEDGATDETFLSHGDQTTQAGDHCHPSTPDSDLPGVDKKARRKLLIASLLCLVFMVAEIVGGILANSLAIATDAAHLMTDFASFMISLFAIYIASRPATKRMSFGWHRAEVMGALVSVLMIWVVTGILVYMAAERVVTSEYEIDATVMLITSAIGICFNLVMLFSLHDTHAHSHGGGGGHGHSHASPPTPTKRPNKALEESYSLSKETVQLLATEDAERQSRTNINVKAAFIHVLGDLIQSVGVLVAALIIYFKPEYKLADPICTFMFSVLVLITTINILRDTLTVLMEGTPTGVSFADVKAELSAIPGVLELHNLRLWSLTTSRTAVAVHLAVDKESDTQLILRQAGALLREKFSVQECTIQTEHFVDEMKDCEQCKVPAD